MPHLFSPLVQLLFLVAVYCIFLLLIIGPSNSNSGRLGSGCRCLAVSLQLIFTGILIAELASVFSRLRRRCRRLLIAVKLVLSLFLVPVFNFLVTPLAVKPIIVAIMLFFLSILLMCSSLELSTLMGYFGKSTFNPYLAIKTALSGYSFHSKE